MWFNKKDLTIHKPIIIDNLHGYVLPHASTKYTGHIMSHTLRFRCRGKVKYIVIIYYPINDNYHHEYYVPYKTLKYFLAPFHAIPLNLANPTSLAKIKLLPIKHNLYVVSADFSHFLPLQKAIQLENCAAHSVMFHHNLHCNKIVDHIDNFKMLKNILHKKYNFQWVGRTRSPGKQAVGYLSFLIRGDKSSRHPNGFFITAYDTEMNTRECLGNLSEWNKHLERDLVKKVLHKARYNSRLTSGKQLNIPVKYYTITYLYKDNSQKFIRGWHSILNGSFFLSDILLENVFNNGKWISPQDTIWPNNNHFKLKETLLKLAKKGGHDNTLSTPSTYYYSEVIHKTLKLKKKTY